MSLKTILASASFDAKKEEISEERLRDNLDALRERVSYYVNIQMYLLTI